MTAFVDTLNTVTLVYSVLENKVKHPKERGMHPQCLGTESTSAPVLGVHLGRRRKCTANAGCGCRHQVGVVVCYLYAEREEGRDAKTPAGVRKSNFTACVLAWETRKRERKNGPKNSVAKKTRAHKACSGWQGL